MAVYGIMLNGFSALRMQPKSSSEMISSLVFGEQYEVLSQEGDWLRIQNISDAYQGWLSRSNHVSIRNLIELDTFKSIGTIQKESSGEVIHIGPGCFVAATKGSFEIAGEAFKWMAQAPRETNDIEEITTQLLGTPYLWGGRSIYAIDCSGFSQMIFRVLGMHIPRDSRPQSELSTERLTFEQLQKGDLAFFTNRNGKINHVGIMLSANLIVHASGTVHKDQITAEGIYSAEGVLTHPFAWGIKKPLVT